MKFEDWVTPDMLIYRTSVEIEYMKEAWQASRENQEKYQQHDFCRAVKCENIYNQTSCVVSSTLLCTFSAKEFCAWLKDNGYKVVKK
jgi:hypothetical protein